MNNWWKPLRDETGMHMSVTRMQGIRYQDIKNIFGQPNIVEKYDNGVIGEVEWGVEILNVKFRLVFRSFDVISQKWKDKDSYKIPDVREEIIDELEIIGQREIAKTVVIPLLQYFALGQSSIGLHEVIDYVLRFYYFWS